MNEKHWYDVFNRLFVSWGLIGFLLVAPICWAFLPFAYSHIKGTDELIKANPLFLVFERMGVSCLWMLALVLALTAILVAFRSMPVIRKFGDDCLAAVSDIRNVWRTRVKWLVLLAVFYSAARICEMAFILGYKWTKITGTSLTAIKDYGYFMGLMLALPLGFVATWFWKLFQSSKRPELTARIDAYGLGGKTTTLSSVAFGACVAFLTLSSGLLYICAEEPCHVWGDILPMTLIACGVAVLTNLGAGCKSMGKLVDERRGSPTFAAILLSSVGINIVMSFLTMVIAFCGAFAHLWWWRGNTLTATFSTIGSLFNLYANGNGFGWALWVVVGLCASVVAPIAQLIGVSLHDREKANLSRYGVRGSDWLVICGGFEPLFVALFMFVAVSSLGGVDALRLCWDHSSVLNSNLLMTMAVLTVVVIAIVKIAEVWAEKNSVIRNALFRQVRGSSQASHGNLTVNQLHERALALSLLKLYDKREELVRQRVTLSGCEALTVLNNASLQLPANVGNVTVFLTNMENGDDYFTTDDPFTADVLKAHALWCEAATAGGVESISLKRFMKKNAAQAFASQWSAIKQLAQSRINGNSSRKEKAMPFVILVTNQAPTGQPQTNLNLANAYIRNWNQLLDEISDAITKRTVVGQVNKMICDFKP